MSRRLTTGAYVRQRTADWKPDLYAYDDYRTYLRDYYEAAKSNQYGFSYRSFSRTAGFSSPNFLKLVIDGDRNLGADSIERFAHALHLAPPAARFFADLVTFNQASSNDAKNAAYARISATRGFRQARRVDGELFTYLSHWYYPAIREMTARADFDEDPAWIASQLVPKIEPHQAEEALALLLRLGLLERNAEDGRLERGDPRLSTGAEVTSLAVANYHGQMIERAAAAVEDLPAAVRDISAVTFCVRWNQVEELKDRLAELRAELIEQFDAEEDPDIVYQLNLQLFPLTRPRQRKTRKAA